MPALSLVRGRGDVLTAIALGGALGSAARWGLAEAFPHSPNGFPWGTWTANVSGALLMGILMAYVVELGPRRRYLRPFVGVGVLGGYTTFSAYALDARTLADAGALPLAATYAGTTLVVGLLAVVVGLVLGRASLRLRRRLITRHHRSDPRSSS